MAVVPDPRLRKIICYSYFLLLAHTVPAQAQQMHIRSKAQAAHQRPMSNPRDRANGADRAPSTAWLAAQEAFSAPRPAAEEPALVVLRRGRSPELVLHVDASSAATTSLPADRPVRVFRVVSLTAPLAVVAGPAAEAGFAAPRPVAPKAVWSAPAPRGRRRVDADRHPGPVRHILQSRPVPMESAPEAPGRSMSPNEEIAALRAMMARLDALFGAIGRARAFRFLA